MNIYNDDHENTAYEVACLASWVKPKFKILNGPWNLQRKENTSPWVKPNSDSQMAEWQHSLHSSCFYIRIVSYQVVFNRIASPPPFGLQENKMPFRQMRDSSHSLSEEVYFKSVSLKYNLYTISYRGLKSMIWWILTNLHTHVSIATSQIQNVSIVLRSSWGPVQAHTTTWGLEQLLIYVEVNSQFLDFSINGSHIGCTLLSIFHWA